MKKRLVLHVPVIGPITTKMLTFAEMQQAVGGYIQSVPMQEGVDLFCNEEGIRLRLPPNPRGDLHGRVILPPAGAILGDFFIVRHDEEAGEQIDLTAEDIAFWTKVALG